MSSWLDAASLKTSWNTKDVEEQSKRWTSRRCCHCKFGVITVKCINLSEKNQGVALKRSVYFIKFDNNRNVLW